MANAFYGYDFKIGERIVHSGITNSPERRESEHKQRWANGHLEVVTGPMTKEKALEWESKKQKTITPEKKK
jgi:hypothetical protein